MLKEVTIALVGKYTKLDDAYASVIKALQHASMACNHKLNLKCINSSDLENETKEQDPAKYHEAWQQLCSSSGVIVPGGFGIRGIEGKIQAAGWARSNNKPYLGICLGMQCAVIEFARNELKWNNANSVEINEDTKYPVVIDMPEHNKGDLGGTMRKGVRKTVFKPDDQTDIFKLYGSREIIEERHRHRYEVNPELTKSFEDKGMHFVGQSTDGQRMQVLQLKDHPYYVAVQFHPEYISRPLKPSPPYLGLILSSIGKLSGYISRGCKFTKSQISIDSDSDEYSDDASDIGIDDL